MMGSFPQFDDDQRDIAPPKVNTKNKIDIIVKKMCPCLLL